MNIVSDIYMNMLLTEEEEKKLMMKTLCENIYREQCYISREKFVIKILILDENVVTTWSSAHLIKKEND